MPDGDSVTINNLRDSANGTFVILDDYLPLTPQREGDLLHRNFDPLPNQHFDGVCCLAGRQWFMWKSHPFFESGFQFGWAGHWMARCATVPFADKRRWCSTCARLATTARHPIPREADLEPRCVVVKAIVLALGGLPTPSSFLVLCLVLGGEGGFWRGGVPYGGQPPLQELVFRLRRPPNCLCMGAGSSMVIQSPSGFRTWP